MEAITSRDPSSRARTRLAAAPESCSPKCPALLRSVISGLLLPRALRLRRHPISSIAARIRPGRLLGAALGTLAAAPGGHYALRPFRRAELEQFTRRQRLIAADHHELGEQLL